jgi:hypothetical protein
MAGQRGISPHCSEFIHVSDGGCAMSGLISSLSYENRRRNTHVLLADDGGGGTRAMASAQKRSRINATED